jgi:hypothetical protein
MARAMRPCRARRCGRVEVVEELLAQLVVGEAPHPLRVFQHGARGAVGRPRREVDVRVEEREQLGVHGAINHRGRLQRREGGLRQLAQAPPDGALNAAADDPAWHAELADVGEIAARLGQGAQHLDDEQRDPLRLALDERDDLAVAGEPSDHGLAERRHLTRREAGQGDGVRAADRLGELRRFVGAVGAEE